MIVASSIHKHNNRPFQNELSQSFTIWAKGSWFQTITKTIQRCDPMCQIRKVLVHWVRTQNQTKYHAHYQWRNRWGGQQGQQRQQGLSAPCPLKAFNRKFLLSWKREARHKGKMKKKRRKIVRRKIKILCGSQTASVACRHAVCGWCKLIPHL